MFSIHFCWNGSGNSFALLLFIPRGPFNVCVLLLDDISGTLPTSVLVGPMGSSSLQSFPRPPPPPPHAPGQFSFDAQGCPKFTVEYFPAAGLLSLIIQFLSSRRCLRKGMGLILVTADINENTCTHLPFSPCVS